MVLSLQPKDNTYCLSRVVLCCSSCCCSVIQSCPTLCDPRYYSMAGFPVLSISLSFLKLMSIESVIPFNHLILCYPLLLLPSVFPSIRVFSNESLHQAARVLELQLQRALLQMVVVAEGLSPS